MFLFITGGIHHTSGLRLTESIKEHFGFLELYKRFATKKRFGHGTSPGNSSRADMRCTRLLIAFRVCFVSKGTLGLRKFGGRANS